MRLGPKFLLKCLLGYLFRDSSLELSGNSFLCFSRDSSRHSVWESSRDSSQSSVNVAPGFFSVFLREIRPRILSTISSSNFSLGFFENSSLSLYKDSLIDSVRDSYRIAFGILFGITSWISLRTIFGNFLGNTSVIRS